jgi:hypothetical protein
VQLSPAIDNILVIYILYKFFFNRFTEINFAKQTCTVLESCNDEIKISRDIMVTCTDHKIIQNQGKRVKQEGPVPQMLPG